MRPSHAFTYEVDPLRLPVKSCHGGSSHRFALARAAVRVQRHVDLPWARHPRSHASVRMRPTDFCQSTLLPEPVPALSGFRPCLIRLACSRLTTKVEVCGAIEGSVVSRRSGPASAGRAATRRGIGPRDVPGYPGRFASRSVHDFTSDTPSPFGSRFRHLRSACVGTEGSRSASPRPVKGAVGNDPRCLPPTRRHDSLAAAPRARLATRPGCPPLATRTMRLSA